MWLGLYKGQKTLFVGSPKITFMELDNAVHTNSDIEQIYFRAGKCAKINSRVLSMFIKKYKGFFLITVEVSISKMYCLTKDIIRNITLILTINKNDILMLKNMSVENIHVKLQGLKGNQNVTIMTKGVENININDLQEKIYKGKNVIL